MFSARSSSMRIGGACFGWLMTIAFCLCSAWSLLLYSKFNKISMHWIWNTTNIDFWQQFSVPLSSLPLGLELLDWYSVLGCITRCLTFSVMMSMPCTFSSWRSLRVSGKYHMHGLTTNSFFRQSEPVFYGLEHDCPLHIGRTGLCNEKNNEFKPSCLD